MDDNKKSVLEIITGSSYEEQSDISITMGDIDKSAKEKLLPRFHLNASKSMIKEGLFSVSASRDWAGLVVTRLEERKRRKQNRSLNFKKMKTEQKKTEQRNNLF